MFLFSSERSPPEKDLSSPMKTPTHASSSRRSGKSRRMLPTTPVERQEQGDSPRQNGLHQSHGSAFHSPRDADEEDEHEEPVRDSHVSPRSAGLKYTPRRNPLASGLHQPRPPMEPRNSWEQENAPDTEILLKDTETFMRSLEEKMKTKTHESPSPEPEVSEALSHRDFDGDIDTDLESMSNVGVPSSKSAYAKRNSTGRTSIPTKSEPKSEQSDAKGKTGKAEPPRKSTIWSRLSQPNKHKRSATASDKENSLMSDNESNSEHQGPFRRNTSVTSSLPIGRGGRKTPSKDLSSSSKKETKKESKKDSAKSKPKADLSKPRQTRSTMLRKSRFGEKDSQDQSDVSPTSSISDLSSSKPTSFKRYGSSRDSNKNSAKARSKPVQSKVDYGRTRTNTGSGRGADSNTQFTRNNLRSQSAREGRAHAGETSSRIMSKIATSRSSSRRSSVSSTDGTPPAASNARKTSNSSWRRYQGESDNDAVDAYIQSVTARRTASSSSYDDNKVKSSSMHNLTNHKGQQQQASVQAAGKLGDEIAHVSSSLAQSLQRLTKMTQGDAQSEAALEALPKEEVIMITLSIINIFTSRNWVFC